jgi:hypothetical protein
MYLLEVHDGLFKDPFQLEASTHAGWTLITPCTADLPNADPSGNKIAYRLNDVALVCPLLYEAGEFGIKDYRNFLLLMDTIIKTAQSGLEWPDVLYKAVHTGGDVSVKRLNGKQESHSIIQFGKKKTLVRIHAFTAAAGRKLAFVSHVYVKPHNSDKTPASEQKRSKRNLQEFLDALDNKTAQFIDSQGGRNGFLNLV